MRDFKKMKIWSQGMEIAELIYVISREFPKEEKFGLTSQIRDAVVSIPSNISEGAGRLTKKDFRKFLNYSLGSAFEVETQLRLSVRLKYTSLEKATPIYVLLSEEQRMIFGLIRSLS